MDSDPRPGTRAAGIAEATDDHRDWLLHEHARDVIYRIQLGPPRRLAYISRAVHAMTGYTPEEHYDDPDLLWRVIYPGDRPDFDRLVEDAEGRLVVRVLHRNGETRWHEHHYTVVRDRAGAPIAIDGIAIDITDRFRLDRERRRLQAEWAIQRDRERLAEELHNSLIQDLYGVGLRLQALRGRPAMSDAGGPIEWAIERLNGSIGSVRAYLEELRPAGYTGDLRASLAHLVEELRAAAFIDVRLEIAPGSLPLPHERQLALFYIAQEALHNVRMHARATRVEVTLVHTPDAVTLQVTDDGVGFEAPPVLEEAVGLQAMRLEAGELGGTLRIDSAPGAGTTVRASLPLPVAALP